MLESLAPAVALDVMGWGVYSLMKRDSLLPVRLSVVVVMMCCEVRVL